MKLLKTIGILTSVFGVFFVVPVASAASQPDLGIAETFSILASTYDNTAIGTVINGDLGYTTPPAVPATVSGNTHVANATYNQAGIDQASALAELNGEICTFSFPAGAIDLAVEAPFGNVGEYTPGVYCIDGAVSIGGGGTITLNGVGVYVFRSTGAFNTSANSIVATSGGASACNVFWTPGAATTLGANSTFMGTIIDPAGITVGSTVTWTGRALAFGGTVSTTTDTINTVPACVAGASSTDTTPVTTPGLPNSGYAPQSKSEFVPMWSVLIVASTFAITTAVILRKRV